MTTLRRSLATAALATAAVATVGMTTATAAPVKTHIPTIGNAASGLTVQLAKGGELKVTLQTASDGGYEWAYVKRPAAKVVKVVSRSTKPAPTTGGSVGGYSTTTYLLKATGAGRTTLNLVMQQSFDPKNDPTSWHIALVVPAS